jgi:hypothetical protein
MALIPKEAPNADELAARGLDKDGDPLKKEAQKAAPKKTAKEK